jgi:hypothetical protein
MDPFERGLSRPPRTAPLYCPRWGLAWMRDWQSLGLALCGGLGATAGGEEYHQNRKGWISTAMSPKKIRNYRRIWGTLLPNGSGGRGREGIETNQTGNKHKTLHFSRSHSFLSFSGACNDEAWQAGLYGRPPQAYKERCSPGGQEGGTTPLFLH